LIVEDDAKQLHQLEPLRPGPMLGLQQRDLGTATFDLGLLDTQLRPRARPRPRPRERLVLRRALQLATSQLDRVTRAQRRQELTGHVDAEPQLRRLDVRDRRATLRSLLAEPGQQLRREAVI